MKSLSISYKFLFGDGQVKLFDLNFNPESFELLSEQQQYPDWTKLDFHQCNNCPLNVSEDPRCPVAINLLPLIKWCSDIVSYTETSIEVSTNERTVSLDTSMQRGISSIFGLIMATSPCPHTYFLRPMARFHLPFANHEETVYRAASMYLLAQYYTNKEGGNPDYELTGLRKKYNNLEKVNLGIADRLRATSVHDAAANAVTLLDLLAKGVPYSIDDALDEIRYMFSDFDKY